jgi:hypothetical protein
MVDVHLSIIQEDPMNNNSIYSSMVRAGRTTYFVDIREAKNGKKYLSISENRIDADEKRQRATIRVFGESIEQFKEAINEASTAAQQ